MQSYFSNGNYTKMYFAPTGIMHRINLHAIPISDKQYLGDKIQLVEMSSTRKILDQKNTSSTNKQLVLMGGIDYEMDTTVINGDIAGADVATRGLFDEIPLDLTSSVNRGGSWTYLKGTEIEISKLNQIAQKTGRKSIVFKGKQATEKGFKELGIQNSPDIIHIATHGFFFPENVEKR
ncbi:MAG: CHAT domain-containing protein [Saprospiraceae bacterium]|nr:CHAT domain-containing protein [Saprospiraceae bacterium]